MKQTGTLIYLMLIGATILVAQDGALDATFNTTGKVTTPVGASVDIGFSVAIQSDGKIVVAGYSAVGGIDDFSAVRYNSDGTLDNTFSSDGKVTTAIGAGMDQAWSVAIQSDGKIVVAGFSNNDIDNDFAVVRYNSDGTLDNTFDSDGKVTTAVGSSTDYGYSVAIQSDGKIVVAGTSFNGSVDDFAVVRYNSDGTLDNTFDSDGKVTTSLGSGYSDGHSVAIQSDGKIVVAGSFNPGSSVDVAVVRYNSDGSLDNTFDSDGKVTTAIGSSNDIGHSVAIQSDGKIVISGYSHNGTNYVVAVVRYNSDGTLDNTFDSDGKVTTALGSIDEYRNNVAIQLDGKIIVAGNSHNGSNYDVAVVRYNSDGTLDNTFDGDGKATTAVGSSTDYGYSVAIQSDGKIVVAGYSVNGGNFDFAVVRYTGSSGPMPVELTSFTAQSKGNGVELVWNTATEVNNYGFEIEREQIPLPPSADSPFAKGETSEASGGFIKAGFVEGAGTTNSPKEYSYIDNNLKAGKYVYRLKQIDRDGQFKYSQEVEFTLGNVPSEFTLTQNYPNPFNPTTTIQFSVPATGRATLKIFNTLGQEVATLFNGIADAGQYYKAIFDAKNLSSGIYFARLSSDGKSQIKKLMLMK